MAQAPAERKVVQLYNELICLPCDQEERIRAIAWQLRGLHRQQPHEIDIRVALAQATAMSGDAEEARAIAFALWHHRARMDGAVLWSYAECLLDLAMYEKAAEVLERFAGQAALERISAALRDVAIGRGDATFFAGLMTGAAPELVPLLQLLVRHSDYFRARQAAVRRVVEGRQVAYETTLVLSDYGSDGEINIGIFVAGDVAERRMLEQRIDDAVAQVSAEFGVPVDTLPIVENVHDHHAYCAATPN